METYPVEWITVEDCELPWEGYIDESPLFDKNAIALVGVTDVAEL